MEKIRVVIAEDEPITARFLKTLVEKTDGCTVQAVCESGEEVLAACGACSPDILLTDISMPGISGLELIRQMKLFSGAIRTVIISGYQNFSYAKEAIALGVEEYLTKPIQPEEVRRTLETLCREIKRSRRYEKALLLEKSCRSMDHAAFLQVVPFRKCAFLGIYLRGDFERLPFMDCIREDRICFFYRNGVFFLQEYGPEAADELKRMLYHVRKEREEYRFLSALVVKNLHVEQDCCRQWMELYLNLHQIARPDRHQLREFDAVCDIVVSEPKDDERIIRKITGRLQTRDTSQLTGQLQELFAYWQENHYSLYRMRNGLHEITEQMHRAGMIAEAKEEMLDYINDCIRYTSGYEQLRDTIISYLMGLVSTRKQKELEEGSQELVERICTMVMDNESTNYSLNEICSMFHISPPYARKLFRTYKGATYNEWVQDQKIGRAKEYLKEHPGALVKEVAERLGYEQMYFSTLFGRATGMSPSEYKTRGETDQREINN